MFNVSSRTELTPESVGARPGNVLVPISNYHALYHLAAVLDRVKVERRDIVVLHVRVLRRSGSGESELDASQLFGSVEQYLFTQALSLAEKRGKTIQLAVLSASDMLDGILRAAADFEIFDHRPWAFLEDNRCRTGARFRLGLGKTARSAPAVQSGNIPPWRAA